MGQVRRLLETWVKSSSRQKVARLAGLPLIVHGENTTFGRRSGSLEEGDVVTMLSMENRSNLMEDPRSLAAVYEAELRVLLDVGHGAASFSFRSCVLRENKESKQI